VTAQKNATEKEEKSKKVISSFEYKLLAQTKNLDELISSIDETNDELKEDLDDYQSEI